MVYIPYLLCKAQELQVVDNGVVTEGEILLMTTQFKKDCICPGSANTSIFIASLPLVKSCVTLGHYCVW